MPGEVDALQHSSLLWSCSDVIVSLDHEAHIVQSAFL